ncbi:MAG: 1-deoxy-D-xylulose-5-phosphate reductoisomerase [Chloroflexi bacterium RBG_13_60_13]|nr:MAG: 1-deoxy-D-xylulose-5-phosphate reductoisomerase [Chloroflexi bacterium RBG_13_60_13]
MGGGLKRIAILGSTGSIGQQTLEIGRTFSDRFRIVGLGAGKNATLLAEQIREFRPRFVSLQPATEGAESPVFPSDASPAQPVTADEMASHPDVDVVVVATSGKAGLTPTLAAIRAGKQVALANKEVLVMAGAIIMAEARQRKLEIIPVDSEHSAIWQCLKGERKSEVARLILTASGGPFLRQSASQLAEITPEQALKHPTWKMGPKVTIDSATLMNKGMEIIEAHWLFGLPLQRIDVVIHPESVVHSMVEFIDGSIKAQLSQPDMRLPIQYAVAHSKRLANADLPRMDFGRPRSLNFEPPDTDRFPCLRIARQAGERGGTYPAVLCAADEVAVDLFLSHRIGFLDIARLVEDTLDRHQGVIQPTLDQILAADAWASEHAAKWRPK